MNKREMANEDILRNYENIFGLAHQETLPISLKRRVGRVWSILRAEAKEFIALREQLWEKHGERDEEDNLLKKETPDGRTVQVFKSKADEETVDKEWKDLMDQLHTLEIEPIPYSDLEAADRLLQKRGVPLALNARQLEDLEEWGFISTDSGNKKKSGKKAKKKKGEDDEGRGDG